MSGEDAIWAIVALILFAIPFIILARRAAAASHQRSMFSDHFFNLQQSDIRFADSRSFKIGASYFLISESGFIALGSLPLARDASWEMKQDADYCTKNTKIIHINDIRGFEVITNGKSTADIGGAVVGGLLFGTAGAIIGGQSYQEINNMSLLFKMDNFKNPAIEVPILNSVSIKEDAPFFGSDSIESGSSLHNQLTAQIREMLATLEVVEARVKK